MTFSSRVIFEVRATGADTNGGGFIHNASGTDYTQQNAAQKSGTDLEVDSSDSLKVKSSSAGSPVAADVGNLINISAGTFWTTGFYEIVSQDGTWWTLDRSPAATGSTGAAFGIGGAIACPGVAWNTARVHGTGNHRGFVWIAEGTYGITNSNSSSADVGSKLHYSQCSAQGYNIATGRGATPATLPVLQLQSSFTGPIADILYSSNASYNSGGLAFLDFDGNGLNGNQIACVYNASETFGIKVRNYGNGRGVSGGKHYHGVFDGTLSDTYRVPVQYATVYYSLVKSNSFRTTALYDSSAYFSVIRGGTSSYPTISLGRHGQLIGCRVYSPDCVCMQPIGGHNLVQNNIFVGDGSKDFWNGSTAVNLSFSMMQNNYYYGLNNVSTSSYIQGVGGWIEDPVALSADPFVDAANDDYTLDSSGSDYSLFTAEEPVFKVPNTTLGPKFSPFVEGTSGGGGSSYTPAASAKFTRLE